MFEGELYVIKLAINATCNTEGTVVQYIYLSTDHFTFNKFR